MRSDDVIIDRMKSSNTMWVATSYLRVFSHFGIITSFFGFLTIFLLNWKIPEYTASYKIIGLYLFVLMFSSCIFLLVRPLWYIYLKASYNWHEGK